jgi:hypothetical protein
LRCTVALQEGVALSVEADYTVSKDGILFGILRTKKLAKSDGNPDGMEHRLFYCRFAYDEQTLTLSDLNCGEEVDHNKMRELIEGKYRKVADEEGRPTTRVSKRQSSRNRTLLPPPACAPMCPYPLPPTPVSGTQPTPAQKKKAPVSEPSEESESFRQSEGGWGRIWEKCAAIGQGVLGLCNQYSSNPNKRIFELLNESENLRQIEGEWERFWMIDQPSHLTWERVHGDIRTDDPDPVYRCRERGVPHAPALVPGSLPPVLPQPPGSAALPPGQSPPPAAPGASGP